MALENKEPVGRSFWQVIAKAKEDFHKCADIQLKNGEGCRFWHDWWVEKRDLADKYPRLYKLSLFKMGSIADFKRQNWNFNFKRDLDPAERIDLLELKHDLRSIILVEDEVDKMVGDLTAKKLYEKHSDDNEDWAFDNVASQRNDIAFVFMFTVQHIRGNQRSPALHCEWAMKIWDYFLNAWNIRWVMQNNLCDYLAGWKIGRFSREKMSIWKTIPYAIIWELWKEINSRVHGGRFKSLDELLVVVKHNLCLWCSNEEVFKGFLITQVLFQWEDVVKM
ncbi:uncharacterized protein LOC113339674 [Papaver somniferum]|uniref:uncharacterized protein LOC113339674 n=1 Tax=Papaver somniferum TaxID=3469 RepID=UPI000E7040FA|nr:uncharacterized protein LOC113339674 [Papaver somniferum]